MRAALGLALLVGGGALAYLVLTGHAPGLATSAGVGDVAASGQAGAASDPTSSTNPPPSGGFGSGGGTSR